MTKCWLRSLIAGLLATLVWSQTKTALACKCYMPSFKKNAAQASHIFEGTLQKLVVVRRAPYQDHFHFLVNTRWKGDIGKTVVLDSPGHSCGLKTRAITKIGARYLIYANRTNGRLHSRQCQRVALSASAQGRADIAKLNKRYKATIPQAPRIKPIALSCTVQGTKSRMILMLTPTHAAQGRLLRVVHDETTGWLPTTHSVERLSFQNKHTQLFFRTSSQNKAKATGTSFRLYFSGQQSQLKGQKHEGKLLLFSLPYPRSANARVAPKRHLCQRVAFPQ